MVRHSSQIASIHHPQDQLIELISRWLTPLGYRVIHLEVQSHRQKVLRIYIDHLDYSPKGIGIEDCARASRALDIPLDESSEIEALLPGAYELEVSSPGINRPLRTLGDFENFKGEIVRIHTFRPPTSEELRNEDYQKKNVKQKNFSGILKGVQDERVILSLSTADKARLDSTPPEGVIVTIPLSLISKANLDPKLEFEGNHGKENKER